jgi:hypothetical protein
VSKRRTRVAGLAVSMSVLWLVFILLGAPWTGLMWVVSLACVAAVWASRVAAQSRSIGQVLADLDTEPVPVIATLPASKAVL